MTVSSKQFQLQYGKDRTFLLPVSESAKKVIVGFDPDVQASGLSVWSGKDGKVHRQDKIRLIYFERYLRDLIKDFGQENLIIRVEVPSNKTIFGVSQKAIGKERFKTIVNSARCQQVAFDFLEFCALPHINLPVEKIQSHDRLSYRSKGKKHLWLKSAAPERVATYVMQRVRFGHETDLFPTKAPASHIWEWYGKKLADGSPLLAGDDEFKDSLILTLREALYRKWLIQRERKR
jgi:hypothetical protein